MSADQANLHQQVAELSAQLELLRLEKLETQGKTTPGNNRMGGYAATKMSPEVKKIQPTKWLRYNNTDKALFPTFLMKLKNFVRVEGDRIGSEVDKV